MLIYIYDKNDLLFINEFLNLKEKPTDFNSSLIKDEKAQILATISRAIKRNVTNIRRIVYNKNGAFGNNILSFNKIIFFCEILKCNEITVGRTNLWFLKNNVSIILDDQNITINTIEESDYNHSFFDNNKRNTNSDVVYYSSLYPFFYKYKIKPKIRIHFLKNEIINNLPKVNISKRDLYMHIRSGDIFSTWIHRPYAQPPLCFYKAILKNFKFNKIYIIAENNNNPIIDKLLNKYNNVIKFLFIKKL